jgi:hypothetical protein
MAVNQLKWNSDDFKAKPTGTTGLVQEAPHLRQETHTRVFTVHSKEVPPQVSQEEHAVQLAVPFPRNDFTILKKQYFSLRQSEKKSNTLKPDLKKKMRKVRQTQKIPPTLKKIQLFML